MRERINRLAKGIVDMETPELSDIPDRLDEEIPAGGIVRREIIISSDNGLHMKGLIYSSNSRVKILNDSFGGIRNRISYEVNGKYLEYGDVIEGSFYLVTNAGEKEIPYSFDVQPGLSGQILGQLKKPQDFCEMARQDFEMALRVFEYRDFVQVPFMRDTHVRAVYDGLRGHGNRCNQLEQFLVGLKLKKPVHLKIENRSRVYPGLSEAVDGEIEIRKSGWGYLSVNIVVEGRFIQTVKKTLSDEDFTDGICHFPFRLHPNGLHAGKNFGTITFKTTLDKVSVSFEVSPVADEEHGAGSERHHIRRMFADYVSLRLDYENGYKDNADNADLLKKMTEELDHIRMAGGPFKELSLAEAELYQLTGHDVETRSFLNECKDQVLNERIDDPGSYCLYQYIMLNLEPDDDKRQSLAILLDKYAEDGTGGFLTFYLYSKVEEEHCKENPAEMITRMKSMYSDGCISPFMYQMAVRIWNDDPQLLYAVTPFELQALHFGARKGAICRELAVLAASIVISSRVDLMLALKVLKLLYQTYPEAGILEAIVSLMIRGEYHREKDFIWYERALEKNLSLTRLYEYYLYSLPKNYKQPIPKEVLLYFSYDNELDQNSRAVLYANIIRYMKEDTPLFEGYQKEIGRFAAEQILKSRIDSNLAVIYDASIYEDMIDEPIAKNLPAILKSCRISVDYPEMRNVIVCYEEITEEGIYPIYDGVAYVPIFSDKSCILFQDAYGNRYADLNFIKTRVLNRPELEKKCFEVYPEHPMLFLDAVRQAASHDVLSKEDLDVIESALIHLNLHPLYKSVLIEKLIHFSSMPSQEEETDLSPFLLSIDPSILTASQRSELCEALISHEHVREAYDIIHEFYCILPAASLLTLCSRMILNRLFDEDDLLLHLAYIVFAAGMADGVILDYLCEHYNSNSRQMYDLLMKSIKEHVETYDLEERLLAQMLFSNSFEKMDQVFTLYITRKEPSELVVRAYLTMKSAQYFLYGEPADEEIFQYLEGMVKGTSDRAKLPTIHLLALSKYYSEKEHLDDEQKDLCQEIMGILLSEGMIFPYFKDLAGQISIPDDVMDKGIIQYIGQKDSKLDLQIRILPQEETFHTDIMKRMFEGVFISQKVLFDGETMEYRIYETDGDERMLRAEGSVTGGRVEATDEDSRYGLLNEMSVCLNLKEEEGLKRSMREYARKNAVLEDLFNVM